MGDRNSEYIAGVLNSKLLGVSGNDRLDALCKEIEAVRKRLHDLLIDKQRLLSAPRTDVSAKDAEGFVSGIDDCSVTISTSVGGMGMLFVKYTDAPMYFHMPYRSYDIGNDNVIYASLPQYSFKAEYMLDKSVAISNETCGVLLNGRMAADWEPEQYSHPHVSGTYPRSKPFDRICFGGNRFVEELPKIMTPSAFLEFARRFHIWATHGNLLDMYDHPAYRTPQLSTDLAVSAIEHADELFLMAQTMLPDKDRKLVGVLDTAGILAGSFSEAFVKAYGLWLLKHMDRLPSGIGASIRTRAMRSAIILDIASDPVIREHLKGAWEERAYNAPRALKKLLADALQADGGNMGAKKLLDAIRM